MSHEISFIFIIIHPQKIPLIGLLLDFYHPMNSWFNLRFPYLSPGMAMSIWKKSVESRDRASFGSPRPACRRRRSPRSASGRRSWRGPGAWIGDRWRWSPRWCPVSWVVSVGWDQKKLPWFQALCVFCCRWYDHPTTSWCVLWFGNFQEWSISSLVIVIPFPQSHPFPTKHPDIVENHHY